MTTALWLLVCVEVLGSTVPPGLARGSRPGCCTEHVELLPCQHCRPACQGSRLTWLYQACRSVQRAMSAQTATLSLLSSPVGKDHVCASPHCLFGGKHSLLNHVHMPD